MTCGVLEQQQGPCLHLPWLPAMHRGPGHPTRGLRANSPIVLSAEPLLSCPFFPHTSMTSFRQHSPRRVWCVVSTSCLWSPRGTWGGRGLRSALTTESPTIPGAPSSWEDCFSSVLTKGQQVTAVTFKCFLRPTVRVYHSPVPVCMRHVCICTVCVE